MLPPPATITDCGTAPASGASEDKTPAAVTAATAAAQETGGLPAPGARHLLALLAFIAALYWARAFFIPLLIGILASYTLRPLVDRLCRLHVPRPAGAALVLAVLVGGLSWIATSLRDDAEAMIEKLPQAARQFRQSMTTLRASGPTPLQHVQEAATELQRAAAEATGAKPRSPAVAPPEPELAAWFRDYALTQSKLLITVAAQAPLVVMLAFFLLASGDHFRRKLLVIVGPSLSKKKMTLGILDDIDAQIQHYMLTMLVINVLVGTGTWLAFDALGLQQAGLWGVAAGVMHFVPYLGPALIALASGIAGFLQFGSLLDGLFVAAASALVAAIAGIVIMTWLQSRVSRINAAVLFIVLLFFGWLWGAWGLLLGAPLLAIAKVICDRVETLRPFGELLGR